MLFSDYDPEPEIDDEDMEEDEENNEFYPFSSMEEMMEALDHP